MSAPTSLRLCRVGLRSGTADELVALHSIEAPIEAERGSNRMPQTLEAYAELDEALLEAGRTRWNSISGNPATAMLSRARIRTMSLLRNRRFLSGRLPMKADQNSASTD